MNILKTKFKYADDSTRLYSFEVEESISADVKGKIKAVNASLTGGTAGGLSSFFVSDAGANFVIIDGATIESSETVPLKIAPIS